MPRAVPRVMPRVMPHVIATVALVLAASLSLGMPQASAATTYRAHWSLNEINSAQAFDSSGNGNHGTNFNVVGDGSAYTFDGEDSRVIVPSSASLNPGFANFSWGVTLSTNSVPTPLGETYDIIRKGLATAKGGNYKIEIKNVQGKALARCVSKSIRLDGTKVTAAIQGTTNLADGRQHAVSCTKTATGLTLFVDALTPRTKVIVGGLGSVSNDASLALGAKAEQTANTGFDWFEGKLYDAWVS